MIIILSYWTIYFKNTERIANTIDTGRIWHGVFFNILKSYDKGISTKYHEQTKKQSFSISPIISEKKINGLYFEKGSLLKVNISLYSHEINKGLLQFIMRNKKIQFIGNYIIIQNVQYKEITEEILSEESVRRGAVKFITPTAFRINPANYILPDPRRLFKILSRSYSSIFEVNIDHDLILEEIEKNVIVEGFKINTEVAKFKKFQVTGFVGTVNFNIKHKDLEIQRYFEKLLALANYIGIGYKTGMGMGQCIVLKK